MMPVAPVHPSVVKQALDVDAHVERLNTFLSRPWTDHERNTGKCFSTYEMSPAEREEVARIFTVASWKVEAVSHQRDGDFLRFLP